MGRAAGWPSARRGDDPYPGSSENAYHRWLRAAHPGLYAQASVPGGEVGWDTLPTEAHYSHWIADETIEFLTSAREDGEPIFFVANFFDPHHGFGAPPEYRERYDPASLPPRVSAGGELESKPSVFTEASKGSYAGKARGFADYTEAELDEARAAYYAMVTLVDDEVGRILDTLEVEGLADDTVVVFTSDDGEMLGDHQLMLKGPFHYDCAVRVPLIVRWPRRLAPARRPDLHG